MLGQLDGMFIRKILAEEWVGNLQRFQRERIQAKKLVSTGHLLNDREYTIGGSNFDVTATEKHVDYERFLDMRRLYRNKKRKGFISRSRFGKKIHNNPIFYQLNVIAYRINWDLAEEVLGNIAKGVNLNIKLGF